MEQENIEFIENLNKMNKKEIVDYIYNYWAELKIESKNGLGKTDYCVDEFSRIKMTQVNKMKNLLTIKSINAPSLNVNNTQ